MAENLYDTLYLKTQHGIVFFEDGRAGIDSDSSDDNDRFIVAPKRLQSCNPELKGFI